MDIPEEIKSKLMKIAQKSNIKPQRIETEFTQLFEALEKDEGFMNESGELIENELNEYLILRLRGKYEIRQPVKSHDIIPVGMDKISETKQKVIRSSLYVIDKDRELKRISLSGNNCDLLADVQLFYKYNDVSLAEMSNSPDMMADERTEFENMEETPLLNEPEKVVQLTKAKKLVLSDIYNTNERDLAKKILSKVNQNNYTVQTDWRAIYGQVTNVRHGVDETNGTNWASFRLIDKTIPDEEVVDSEGNVIQAGIVVYTSPHVIGDLTDYSKVWVLGPLSKSKKGNISMNGFCVITVWTSPEF